MCIALGRPSDRKWRHAFGGETDKEAMRYDEVREACLSQEIAYIAIDHLRIFMREKELELSRPHQHKLMDALFSTLIAMMQRKQSVPVILEIFRLLREFVHKYSKHLFTLNTPYCAHLTAQILHFCNYQNIHVRVEASAFLFLLMKVRICE